MNVIDGVGNPHFKTSAIPVSYWGIWQNVFVGLGFNSQLGTIFHELGRLQYIDHTVTVFVVSRLSFIRHKLFKIVCGKNPSHNFFPSPNS